MTPQDILNAIPGLNRDKLSYYTRMGYVQPRIIKRGTLNYTEYYKKDLIVMKKAFHYISKFGSRPSVAFEKAREDLEQS